MIINGAIECGPSPANPTASYNRQNYYRKFAADFNVNINGEKLGTEANLIMKHTVKIMLLIFSANCYLASSF
jgi:hypothetical protein